MRVLLTLNTGTVDLHAEGVNRTDGDFASVWIRRYGQGRVFYSAFGHFDDSFRLPMFRTILMQALLWLTGGIEMDATPRSDITRQVEAHPGWRSERERPNVLDQFAEARRIFEQRVM